MKKGNAHQELTDPENEKVLGTYTYGFWRGSAVELVASRWWGLGEVRSAPRPTVGGKQLWHPDHPWSVPVHKKDEDPSALEQLLDFGSPLEMLMHEARQTSGSIGGEHRRDLTHAIVGAPPTNLGIAAIPTATTGDGEGEAGKSAKKERGFG